MSKQTEAMKLALDALEDIFGKNKVDVGAINALREALAEPVQPTETLLAYHRGYEQGKFDAAMEEAMQEPPTWVSLTDEEIGDEFSRLEVGRGGFNRFEYAVRALEVKLKEKNS